MHPILSLKPRMERRIRSGHPWFYSNEVNLTPHIKSLPPGSLVSVQSAEGAGLGTATFNPGTLMCGRMLADMENTPITAAFFAERLQAALALRQRFLTVPYYRLIHAEADRLPGVVIDRYGSNVVVQITTAGMELLKPQLTEAIEHVLAPETIVFRNDTPARLTEGLPQENQVLGHPLTGPVDVLENGVTFTADLLEGQKTGWFYDQRENRAHVATLAQGQSLLDVFTHTGGFGITAAVAGASAVTLVDASAFALQLAHTTAAKNNVAPKVDSRCGDAFDVLPALLAEGKSYHTVVLDPPAFVKSAKHLEAGLKGYQKLARQGAQLVKPGGFLFMASCSHNVGEGEFLKVVAQGVHRAGRTGRILRVAGAGFDHPRHPFLNESAYLKAVTFQLD